MRPAGAARRAPAAAGPGYHLEKQATARSRLFYIIFELRGQLTCERSEYDSALKPETYATAGPCPLAGTPRGFLCRGQR